MFSIIIPTLNEGANLWFTIQGIQMILDNIPHDEAHELIVVDSGSTDNTVKFVESLKFVKLVQTTRSGGGPVRQAGAEIAQGDVLFFLDAHVLLSPNFFRDSLQVIREQLWNDLGVLHFPIGWDGDLSAKPAFATHYVLTLEKNFWGYHSLGGYQELTEISMAGHGALAVKTSHFRGTGGYAAPFVEYGGEESYLDLKMARFGYRNYLYPNVYVMHCSQRQVNYQWSNETLFRNNVIAAFIVGGRSWAEKVFDHECRAPDVSEKVLMQLYDEGIAMAGEDKRFVEEHATLTLNQVLQGFKDRNVPH